MEMLNEIDLRMRKNNDFLWISSEAKKIYLKEHTSCLLLHFSKTEDMMEYIQELIKKGYVVE